MLAALHHRLDQIPAAAWNIHLVWDHTTSQLKRGLCISNDYPKKIIQVVVLQHCYSSITQCIAEPTSRNVLIVIICDIRYARWLWPHTTDVYAVIAYGYSNLGLQKSFIYLKLDPQLHFGLIILIILKKLKIWFKWYDYNKFHVQSHFYA